MERYTRTPYYKGEDDPEIGEARGPLKLGETVIIETVGGHDQDYENNHEHRAGAVMEVKEKRHSRQGGPFYIEGIEPGEWVSMEIMTSSQALTAFTAMAGPTGGAFAWWRR